MTRDHAFGDAEGEEQRTAYTLLVGMRTWLFAAFKHLPRECGPGRPGPAARAGA